MGRITSAAVGVWLLVAGIGYGQAPPPVAPQKAAVKTPQPKELPPIEAPPVLESESALLAVEAPQYPHEIFWFRSETMFMNIGNSVQNVPLVTTGNPADGILAGTFGQPDTRVLQNTKDLTNGYGTGLRFILGAWLDNSHDWGIEGSGFLLIQAEHTSSFNTDSTGNPPLYLPAYNVQLEREDSAIIGDPLLQFGAGGVQVQSRLAMWGTELNGLYNLRRDEEVEWTFLSGLRYFQLRETFRLFASSRDLILNQGITLEDRFATSNQFLAYQLGSRVRFRYKKLFFDITGKVAVGGNLEQRSIDGMSTSFGPDATNPGVFPGGFFAQKSNIGSDSHTVLAAMPSLEVRVSYPVTPRILLSVGYDLWYLSHSVRVANQIDRNLNLSQSAVLASPAPPGPVQPRRTDESNDITVQAISFGVEFRY